MSLRLLVDEDSQSKALVALLRKAGHNVLTVNEAQLTGTSDAGVLAYAQQNRRVILTQNCDDFEALHEQDPDHAGILAIYNNDDYSKNMNRNAIVSAIANLESAGVSLDNQFMALNQWNY